MAEAIRRIGYVSQSVGLYRGLSVADNLGVGASLRPGLDVAGAADRPSFTSGALSREHR